MKTAIYEEITARLISEIEAGKIPWKRPWFGCGDAWSRSTGKPYQGVNAMLPPGEYATFAQIKKEGGKVKKGAKSYPVIFSAPVLIPDPDKEGEKKCVYTQKVFRCFLIGEQTEGIEPTKQFAPPHDGEPLAAAETLIDGYADKPAINPCPSSRAYYQESGDTVVLPRITQFVDKVEYYSVLFHELTHSTGAKKRLNRSTMADYHNSRATRAKEELIAELGAAFLCGKCGITNTASEKNTAAYLQAWLEALKNDKKYIFSAMTEAKKAVEYIQGTQQVS